MDLKPERLQHWEETFRNEQATLVTPSEVSVPTLPMRDCFDFFIGRNVGEIVDIGCGNGEWAAYLARCGFIVQGFDFSPAAVELARARGQREKLAVEFECAAVTAFPFPFEIFDAAIATFVLDILTPREMAMTIDQMARYIRRGGVAFALFHPFEPSNPAGLGYIPYKDSELRRLFPGFRLLEFRSYPGGARGLFLKRE